MTKIKNTGVYIKETEPTLSDFLVGTKDSNGKTKSFSLEAILQLLNSSNGVNNIQFKFSNGLHPTIDFLSAGYFFTDTNTTEVGTFTELIFNKESIQPLDLSPLFNKLGELDNVIIKLENPEDPNNFFNFKVVSFTDNTDYFTFGIEDFNELYLGEFENEKIYSFYFDILSESNFYITGTNDDAGGIKTGSITKRGELVIDSEEGNISGLVLNQVPNLVVTAYTIITPNTGENEPYIRPIGCMGNDDFYYVPMYPGIRKVNTTTGVIEDFSTFIGEPTAVCLGLDGFFYVLVSNSIIRIHPTTGAVMSTIYSGVNLSNAQCLVHATDNNIYIGFSVSPEGLGRLTLAGDLTIFSTIDGHCLYIDQGSDGLLYCNTGSRIYKATLDGIQTDFITLPTILALYCATDGFIYTHRYGLGILYKITYSGTIEELPVGLGEVIRAIDQSQNGTFYFNSENVVGKLNLPSNKVLKTDENGNVVKTTYLEDVQYLVPTDILGKEDKINKGVANGYASLGPDGFTLLSEMNPSTLERFVVVADQAARFALTTATVQNGDTVKQLDTGIMYYVKDDTNLSNSSGYELYRAGTAASVPWTGVTGTPTSLTGYGIIPASGDYTTALVTETTNKNYQTDNQKLFNDATSSIQTQLNNRELITNKQNSLTLDGNGEKFTTVDAVNQVIGYVTPEQFGAVGDGITDDTVAFVSALAASNFVYTLKNSVYLIGNVDVIGKKIYGNGTIRKKASSESAFHVKGSGSVIDGLRFDAEIASSQPSTDIKLGDGSKNIVISNCVFMSKIYSSISGAVDTTVGGTPYAVNVDGVIVINNVFTKLSSESIGYERPIYLHSVSNITIQGNIIRDTARDAIRLRENDGNCVVNGNQFINIGDPSWPDTQTRDAIDVYWSGNTLTISNNIINKTAHSGFDIKGSNSTGTDKTSKVIITGNQISHTRYHGILIQGNVINPNFYYTESIIVANNVISKCNDDAGTSGYGIYCDGLARFVNIHDNVVTETKGRGIVFNNVYPLTTLGTKNIKISGNQCFNNGCSGSVAVADAGIYINSIDGVILTNNISSNDTSLPNPYQACGIYINSTSTGFPASKSMIVSNNITRDNITGQIFIDSNNQRADNIAVFSDNIQSGTGAVHRGTWQDQRSSFWGSGIPLTGDGIFRRGDIIRNISPSIIGSAGNRYTVTGWERVSATGNTHVLNTDWVEMRTLTDNTEFATLASPAFTGNPTAPTATAGTNTTQIATTAFVTGAIATADAGNPTNTAYVETSGNNATAQLGNSSRPFLTIDAALDALPAGGGVVKIGIGTFASPAVAKIKSNTAFIGSKEPIINSTITFATPTSRATITAPTALIDGTILSGQFRIEDRNNIRIENLGVDAGKTYIDTFNGGVATNAMAILSTVSTTPCKNITVNNSTALGYSPSALFHAFVFQNVTDCHFSNLTSYYNTHGLVIKGTNVTVDGLNAHSHTADGLNIKSDIYAPCADVSLSNINISSLSGYEGGGISLEQGVLGSSPLDRITISNVNLKYVSYGVRNVNTVKNVSISSLNAYDLNSFGFKLDTNVDNVNLSNINIVKTLTEGIDVSINGTETVNITNTNVSDATGTGFKLTTAGTSIINIVNSNTLTTTASYLITGTGVYGNSNFGTGTKTGNINFKSQSIIDSVSGVNFFTGLATQTVNMLALPTGTISFANANTSTSPTIYSKSSNSRGLLILTGTPDVNASADFEFGVRKNDNTDFSTLTSTAFRFTRFGTTLIDVLRNGNTTFAGNISAPLFTGSASLTGNPTAPTATAGDNDTSIATTAFVTGAIATAKPYKVYTAILNQTGISDPVATVLENTTGATVVWTRASVGQYLGTFSSGVLTLNKTIISPVQALPPYTNHADTYRPDLSTVRIITTSIAANTDGLLNSSYSYVEIRVYP